MKITKWLLYSFLFLLPTQLGKHWFLPFSYLSGVRIDYLSLTIYLTDLLTLALIILYWKKNPFKMNRDLWIFIGIIAINILFSLSPIMSIYKTIKIVMIWSLFLIFKEKLDLKNVLLAFVSGSIVQIGLVLFQITQGHTLQGIAYFLGERYFSISTPGIAKIAIQGAEILRGYGSFSHPNSLAGFYLLMYTWVLFEKKLHKYIFLKYTLITCTSLLILLSFSKVAISGYVLISLYFVSKHITCKLCRIGRITGLLVLSFIFISGQGDPFSFEKRIYLMQNAWQTILQFPLTGTGLGAYLIAQIQFPIPYAYLFLQPVHNIFLLLIAELGLAQSGFIFYKLYLFIKKHFISELGIAITAVVLFTGFFDHYWFTLQQNMIVLPVVFGLAAHQK